MQANPRADRSIDIAKLRCRRCQKPGKLVYQRHVHRQGGAMLRLKCKGCGGISHISETKGRASV